MLNELDHREMVSKLAKSGEDIRAELTAHDAHLVHMVMGISGEAGELLDAVKKATIYRKPVDIDNIIEELGDIEFYLEGLRCELNLTREMTLKANMAKLAKRYEGFKYSDQAAQDRADKEPTEVHILWPQSIQFLMREKAHHYYVKTFENPSQMASFSENTAPKFWATAGFAGPDPLAADWPEIEARWLEKLEELTSENS